MIRLLSFGIRTKPLSTIKKEVVKVRTHVNGIRVSNAVNKVIRTEQARLIAELERAVTVDEALRSLLGLPKEEGKEKK